MPETLGTIIVSAVASAEIASTAVVGSITVASIVGTTVLVGGSIALQLALRPDAAEQPKPQDGQIVTRQTIPARRRGYGWLKLGGPMLLSYTVPPTRFQVVALHHGEIDAIVENWFSEFNCVVNGFGKVLGHFEESGTPRIELHTHLGTDTQAADTLLTANLAAAGVWTSNHRARGIAYAAIATTQTTAIEAFPITFPGNLPPPYRAVARASKVWDPRVGGQDKDNPTTWTWSDNPVLIALDYHRHADGMGLDAFDAVYLTSAALTADWIPAANICDEVIGGQPRYSCWGSYLLPSDAPANVLAAILSTCDGQTYQRGDGAIGIRVGKTIAPSVALDDAHILGYEGFVRGDNVFRVCNEVTAKYTSPDHDYQETDAQAWRDEADISARGQVLTKDIQLLWVPRHRQARRLMKLEHARCNPEWRGTVITDMAGMAAHNERYISLTIDELSIVAQSFEITAAPETIVSPGGVQVRLQLASLDQSAFDWNTATEDGTPPPVPPNVQGAAGGGGGGGLG